MAYIPIPKETTQLTTGYYWIKINKNSSWTIGFYNKDKQWEICGTENIIPTPFLIDYTKLEKLNEGSKTKKIFDKLDALAINEKFDKNAFIRNLWNKDDYFTCRSFDVLFSQNKVKLKPKVFKSIQSFITRIK